MLDDAGVEPGSGDTGLIANLLGYGPLQTNVANGQVIFSMRLMAHRTYAQCIDERVVNEEFFFFEDLVAFLSRTRGAKPSGDLILDQELLLHLPTGAGPDPFERPACPPQRIVSKQYRASLLVETPFVGSQISNGLVAGDLELRYLGSGELDLSLRKYTFVVTKMRRQIWGLRVPKLSHCFEITSDKRAAIL